MINNEEELISKIDNLILTNSFEINEENELNIKKEGKIEGHGKPITKEEILNLFQMEQSICRIEFERIEDNKQKTGHGSGFFVKLKKIILLNMLYLQIIIY